MCRAEPGQPPLGGGVDPGEQPQQGRLADTVGTHDPDERPRGQHEVDPAQHPGAAEAVPVAHSPEVQGQLEVFSGRASLGRTMTKPSPWSIS